MGVAVGRAAAAAARTEVEVTGSAMAAAAAARVAGAVAATAAVAAVEARVGGGSGRSSRRRRARRRAGTWLGRPDSWCRGRCPPRSPGTGSSCVLRPATSSHIQTSRLDQRAPRHQSSSRSDGHGSGLRLLWPGLRRPEAVASTVWPTPPHRQHSVDNPVATRARAVLGSVGHRSCRVS